MISDLETIPELPPIMGPQACAASPARGDCPDC